METQHADYLIVGQGLCGTFLSYYLLQKGKKVLLIDNKKPQIASKVASGIINPVTGRRIVRTWRIEELLPYAGKAYNTIGTELKASLIKQSAIIDFHPSLQMKEAYEKRQPEEPDYLQFTNSEEWAEYFQFYFGAGKISPCLLIDIQTLLRKWQDKLHHENLLLSETFHIRDCVIHEDCVEYKNITASKIIFCDGAVGTENPYFKNLPFALNKGEALIASIPDLSADYIYKQGISIVPWKNGLFWVGSNYQWDFKDDKPSPAFKDNVTKQLKNWLKIPFEITDHLAAIRPANVERRPFVGLHPTHKSVGIFNGMGTKGCSLAPFFGKQFADYLTEDKPLCPEVDVKRFERVLNRKGI